MRARTTRRFWRLFSDLPSDAQREIGLDYRALAVMKKDHIVWYWIGNHADCGRLV
jgi:hypothetical protein